MNDHRQSRRVTTLAGEATEQDQADRPQGDASDDAAAALVGAPADRVTRSTNSVNALIHLYRAEMGRMTAYRTRLDTTTNWAITSSGLVGTFAFGNESISHAALLFAMLLNLFFLFLEARRFRHYEASRSRVQLLERHFYPEILERPVSPDWSDELLASLCPTRPPVSLLTAAAWRVRRNYLWIYFILLLAWVAKLELPGGPLFDAGRLVTRAAIGSVPGWSIWAVVAGFYAWLVFLALRARWGYLAAEDW
jgi:uncharacterized membrane protein